MRQRKFVIQDKSGKKHLKVHVQCPNGCNFLWVLASTPSDTREWPRATATLRRNLESCGYPDERKFLRISTDDDSRRIANEIHELVDQFLDALEASSDDEPQAN